MKKNEILRSYGTDYKGMTKRLLKAADLSEQIPSKAARIFIKPNLVTPTPASYGATTHPEVVAGIIEYLKENGFADLTIAEGSWVGDRTSDAFEYCGYNALADEYDVRIIDTKKQPGVKADAGGLELNICRCVQECDFLINVPVVKGHCQTHVTCALKNMKGLIPDSEKRRFHTMGLHRPIAHLNTAIHQDFIVADHICGDPGFEEGGNPLVRDCIMAARDPVLLDAFACRLLDHEIEDVPYIKMAEQLGVGTADLSALRLITVEGENSKDVPTGRQMLDISYAVDEIDSCSACYAALVPALSRLEAEGLLQKLAFPVSIGQGHQNKSGRIGVGDCTSGFDFFIPGCPPDEEDICNELKQYIIDRN